MSSFTSSWMQWKMSRWLKRSDKDSQTNEDKLKKNKGDTGQVTKQMMNGGRTGGQSLRRAASGLDVAEEETPPSKAEPLWGSGRRPTARLEIKWLAPEGFDSGTEPAAPLRRSSWLGSSGQEGDGHERPGEMRRQQPPRDDRTEAAFQAGVKWRATGNKGAWVVWMLRSWEAGVEKWGWWETGETNHSRTDNPGPVSPPPLEDGARQLFVDRRPPLNALIMSCCTSQRR